MGEAQLILFRIFFFCSLYVEVFPYQGLIKVCKEIRNWIEDSGSKTFFFVAVLVNYDSMSTVVLTFLMNQIFCTLSCRLMSQLFSSKLAGAGLVMYTHWTKMAFVTKIKWVVLSVVTLSVASIIIHLSLAKLWSVNLVQYKALPILPEDFGFVLGRQVSL